MSNLLINLLLCLLGGQLVRSANSSDDAVWQTNNNYHVRQYVQCCHHVPRGTLHLGQGQLRTPWARGQRRPDDTHPSAGTEGAEGD